MSKKQFYKKKAVDNKKIARERIEILFTQAREMFSKDSSLSDRYVEIARKISMKYNVRLTSEERRSFCKHCYKYLVPSVNCHVRVRDDMIVYSCHECKKFSRFRYKN